MSDENKAILAGGIVIFGIWLLMSAFGIVIHGEPKGFNETTSVKFYESNGH